MKYFVTQECIVFLIEFFFFILLRFKWSSMNCLVELESLFGLINCLHWMKYKFSVLYFFLIFVSWNFELFYWTFEIFIFLYFKTFYLLSEFYQNLGNSKETIYCCKKNTKISINNSQISFNVYSLNLYINIFLFDTQKYQNWIFHTNKYNKK